MQSFQSLIEQQTSLDALNKQGILTPTPIQSMVIPKIKSGESVLATAKTGSGKTLAFALPLLDDAHQTKGKTTALVLTPTRELTLQVTDVFNRLILDDSIKVLPVYGGQARTKQQNKLFQQPEIIVATPGRLLDFLRTGELSLDAIKHLVIDEADQMLLHGFKSEMEQLLKFVPKGLQLSCFSATIDTKVKKLAYRFVSELSVIESIEEPNPLPNVFIHVSDRWKRQALVDSIKDENPFMAIIFCRTIRRAEELHAHMVSEHFNCAIIHGELSQNHRSRIIKDFRALKYQFLISTDLNARGMDISGITHIFNYDFPESEEAFVHRIGRTARMGKEGIAFNFVTPKDEALFEQIKKTLDTSFEEMTFERNDSKE